MVYQRMAAAVKSRGGQVYYQTPVRHVIVADAQAIGVELAGGEQRRFDHVVSTMPLTLLVERMDGVPDQIKSLAKSLPFP